MTKFARFSNKKLKFKIDSDVVNFALVLSTVAVRGSRAHLRAITVTDGAFRFTVGVCLQVHVVRAVHSCFGSGFCLFVVTGGVSCTCLAGYILQRSLVSQCVADERQVGICSALVAHMLAAQRFSASAHFLAPV